MQDNDDNNNTEQDNSERDLLSIDGQYHYNPYMGHMPAHEDTGMSVVEGTQAQAGNPLSEGVEFATQEEVINALQEIYDPEIPVNIYDLGLIYECAMDKLGNVDITMTLTTPACPVAGEMPGIVARKVAGLDGVGIVVVSITWSPIWTVDMMSDDARLALGM
jgi:FeS assembly SUF system protein